MPSSRELQHRIRSVASTSQITRAMGLVAAVRLRRAQSRLQSLEQYSRRLDSLLVTLTLEPGLSHPLMEPRDERRRLLLVFGSDRGLCGNFNRDMISSISSAVGEAPPGIEIDLVPVGNRIGSLLGSSGFAPTLVERHITARDCMAEDSVAYDLLKDWFLSGITDSVHVAAASPVSASMHRISIQQLLPLEGGAGAMPIADFLYEPTRRDLLDALVPECLRARLASAAAGSEASEQMARLTAMTAATKNADDMLADLRLASNKARQSAITRELTEIVAGTA